MFASAAACNAAVHAAPGRQLPAAIPHLQAAAAAAAAGVVVAAAATAAAELLPRVAAAACRIASNSQDGGVDGVCDRLSLAGRQQVAQRRLLWPLVCDERHHFLRQRMRTATAGQSASSSSRLRAQQAQHELVILQRESHTEQASLRAPAAARLGARRWA